MKLPKEITTVTRLSKLVAMILFLALPIVGFLLGMRHQQIIDSPTVITTLPTPTIDKTANPDSIGANWKTYEDKSYGFYVKIPPTWYVHSPDSIADGKIYPGVSFSASNHNPVARNESEINNILNSKDNIIFQFSIGTNDTRSLELIKDEWRRNNGEEGDSVQAGVKDFTDEVVASRMAIRVLYVNPKVETLFVKSPNNYLYQFMLYSDNEQDKKILDQILSTFKFTE